MFPARSLRSLGSASYTLAMSEVAGGPQQPVVGVLLVHGIGNQRRGEALQTQLRAILDWIHQRLGSNESAVTVTDANLRNPAESAYEPPNARVELGPVQALASQEDTDDPSRSQREQWLVAESWWASSFYSPRYGEMMSWTLTSAAVTLAADLGEVFRQLVPAVGGQSRVARTLEAIRYLVPNLIRLYARALVLCPALLILVALMAGRIVPPVRNLATRLQNALTGSIGDSHALVRQPVVCAAIVGRVERDLRWLIEQDVGSIVVIAHSQGAEVARLALLQAEVPATLPLRFVTYGSGVRRLSSLREARRVDHPVRRVVFQTTSFALAILATLSGIVLFAGATELIALLPEFADRLAKLGLDQDAQERAGGSPEAAKFVLLFLALIAIGGLAILGSLIVWAARRRFRRPRSVDRVAPGPPDSFGKWFARLLLAVVVIASMVALCTGHNLVALIAVQIALSLFLGWLFADYSVQEVTRPSVTRRLGTPSTDGAGPTSVASAWVDIRASADPVATGPTRTVGPSPQDRVIHNLRSTLFDHSSYWNNWVSFLPVVIEEISAVSSWQWREYFAVGPNWQEQQEKVRAHHTGILVLWRLVITLAVCIAIVVVPLGMLGKRLLEESGLSFLSDRLKDVWIPWIEVAVGIGIIVAAAALIYRAIGILMNRASEKARVRALSPTS